MHVFMYARMLVFVIRSKGVMIDPINGTTATVHEPGSRPYIHDTRIDYSMITSNSYHDIPLSVSGQGGESGSVYNTQWPANPGSMWQGGSGCEFGGGGIFFMYVYIFTFLESVSE